MSATTFFTPHCTANGTPVKTGFAHVPLLPQMVWDESKALPLEETVKTLRQIIENLSEILTEEEHARRNRRKAQHTQI